MCGRQRLCGTGLRRWQRLHGRWLHLGSEVLELHQRQLLRC